MTDHPHLDEDHLDSLLEFLATEKVRVLFESAMRGAVPLVSQMRTAVTTGDANELYRAGHNAKGMFGNLGLRRCEDLSRTLEALGKAGQLAEAAGFIDSLQHAIDETSVMLNAWIESK